MKSPATSDVSSRALPRHFLYGLLMGAADAVPGVSGGTVAFIVGIYDRLIASIGEAFHAILAIIRLDGRTARSRLRAIEWSLVLPLAAGIATALVIAAGVVLTLLERFPEGSRALFLGMVAASVAVPWKRILERTRATWFIAAIGAIAAFAFTGFPPGTVADPSPVQILGAAMVAICAMILPGVSGAFLLLVLGMYEPTLDAVHNRDLGYVAVFGAGAVLGLGSFSLVLGAALRRYHDETMALLVGLMIGSLRALWPWQTDDRGLLAPSGAGSALTVIAIAIAGFTAVFALERWGIRHQAPSTVER